MMKRNKSAIISIKMKKFSCNHESRGQTPWFIKETINYYPFGSEMTMNSPAQITPNPNWQPYRFSGKELIKQNGLNMYDFGARLFDVAGVPMWTSMDPLCENNYSTTPYSYCNGDPVNKFDPDGKKIVFANGSSDTFKSQFYQAVNYLKENGCGKLYETLEGTPREYVIKETVYQNSYDNQSMIEWAPLKGMYTESAEGYNLLSPATLLNHEFGHACDQLDNPDYDPKATDEQYGFVVEKNVITGVETKTAQALGELSSGDVTRIAYNGIKLDAASPISNELKITDEVANKMKMWNP